MIRSTLRRPPSQWPFFPTTTDIASTRPGALPGMLMSMSWGSRKKYACFLSPFFAVVVCMFDHVAQCLSLGKKVRCAITSRLYQSL